MSEKKLGQEPSFPSTEYKYTGDGCHNYVTEPGMSKRFYAACAAMQGLLASGYDVKFDILIRNSYECADELLKQENQ